MSTFTSRVMSHSDSRPSIGQASCRDTRRVSRRGDAETCSPEDRGCRRSHLGCAGAPGRRDRPEELRRDGRGQSLARSPGASWQHLPGSAPTRGAGQCDGEPWGPDAQPGPSRAGQRRGPRPASYPLTLSPGCLSWALLCSSFYLNFTHSHPGHTPHRPNRSYPVGFQCT